MKTTPRRTIIRNKSGSQRELKRLQFAEARYRYELLSEERALQQSLADFWDARFDETGNYAARPNQHHQQDLEH